MKILILASNPRKDLNLDREIRDLKDVIERSNNRHQFEVEDALAVRVGELQELLFKHKPQIVHFCGHGGGRPGLVFEDNNGREQWVRTGALRDLFRLFSAHVGCVVLNACYSEEQANEIVDHIDYVIGMNQEIRDDAAIAFSKGFYRALSHNCSIQEAYEFGCNAIQLEITGNSIVRSGAADLTRKAEVVSAIATTIIPEHLKPTLKAKPSTQNFERSNSNAQGSLAQGEKEAIQWELAQEVRGTSPNKATPSEAQTANRLLTPQTSKVPAPHSHRLTQLLAGSFIACLLTVGGIYGYRYWQNDRQQQQQQVQKTPPLQDERQQQKKKEVEKTPPPKTYSEQEKRLQEAIGLAKQGKFADAIGIFKQLSADPSFATQHGSYLEDWSTKLLKQAEKSYDQGEIDVAIGQAQKIPESTSVYEAAQAKIKDWSNPKVTKTPPPTNSPVPTIDPVIPPPDTSSTPDASDILYTWLSKREATEADLAGKSATELKIMRNSIYARYGLTFNSELKSIFSKSKEYKPTYPFKDAAKVYEMFSALEKENHRRIKDAETKLTR